MRSSTFCKKSGMQLITLLIIQTKEAYDFYDGMTTAYEHVINYCRHMLGYSGTMPSEVPNQSEDAKE